MPINLLAFSSSRVGNSAYLETVVPVVKNRLSNAPLSIAFVPYASVDSYNEYLEKVSTAFTGCGYQFRLLTDENPKPVLETCDVIMIGGGNTFKLLHHLYENDLVDIIKERVDAGTPYIGWSAGSNITGATICTTNDMPIIEPRSFKAFNFLPFQLNPHYINEVREGHNGETRDQRLTEFVKLNNGNPVVAIPEGSWLELHENKLSFLGTEQGFIFLNNEDGISKTPFENKADLSCLLQ